MAEHLYPRSVADLELAPVLISIGRNLCVLRDGADLEYALVLELNDDDSLYHTPTERARRIQRFATRGVSLHGCNVYPSADRDGLAAWHGDFSVTLAFGKQVTDYVRNGAGPVPESGTNVPVPRPFDPAATRGHGKSCRWSLGRGRTRWVPPSQT